MDKLRKAKIDLALTQPFFGTLLMKLKLKEDPSCETFYTDGEVIGYNPDFAKGKSSLELKTILCHEVLHVACLHPWRRGNRNHDKWNRACDYAVNGILEKNGFLMPTDCLLDPIYTGLCAEEIYNRLPDTQDDQQGKGQDKDSSGFGEVRDYQGTEAEKESASCQMEVGTKLAEKMARGCGNSSGIIEQVATVKSNRVDWGNLLRQFVSEVNKADYSFSRPNRRYIAQGMFLPDLHSRQLGSIVIAIDTSASVATDEIDGFFSEINGIIQECQPSKTIVIQCDTSIRSYEELTQGELAFPTVIGRGGTRFLPVFDRVESEGLHPACLIYLTDLDASFDGINPDYPVLWVSTNRHILKAPMGETIHL